MAKNFDEFADFLLGDCRHELSAVGKSFETVFTDEQFFATGLTKEQIGALMQIVGYSISSSIMVILHRYHEWLTEFPE